MNPDNNDLNRTTNCSVIQINLIFVFLLDTNQSSTCFVNVCTNLDDVELSRVISDINITDHFQCLVLFSLSSNENENMDKAFRDFSHYNINDFSAYFKNLRITLWLMGTIMLRLICFWTSYAGYIMNVSPLDRRVCHGIDC